MALHEVPFASANGRDEIQAWIHVPAAAPRGAVQIIHGLGEHSGGPPPAATSTSSRPCSTPDSSSPPTTTPATAAPP